MLFYYYYVIPVNYATAVYSIWLTNTSTKYYPRWHW